MEEDAVGRFIAVLRSTPKETQYNLLHLCCFALGIKSGPCNVVSFDDLQTRMRSLTEQSGVSEALMIPGLFRYLVEYFECNVEASLELEASDPLGSIEQMKETRATAPGGVRNLLSDEMIEGLFENAKEVIRDFPSYRETCQRSADAVRAIWNSQFPREFWLEWRKHKPSPDD